MKELLTAQTNQNGIKSSAVYSPCKKYRYSLTRTISNSSLSLLFILLNPSTATELANDSTVSRCQKRAGILGYGSFRICNLFAYRTKSPAIMKKYPEPIGPQNDHMLHDSILWATKIICAWGGHGTHLNRSREIREMIDTMGITADHLGLTKNNQPKHPLYLSYSQKPVRWI